MKLTDSIDVHACRETMSVVQDGAIIDLTPADAEALAFSLSKWSTNPYNIAGHGVEKLRALSRLLDAEADRRAARADTKAGDA